MRGAFAILGLCTLGACTDPTITIAIDWSRHPALDGKVTELRVTVNTLTDQPCAALVRGDVGASELALGLETAVSVANDHRAHALDRVPRLGPKLFVLEGYDVDHRRIAAGCQDHGDIDADLELAIAAEPVIVTRVLLDPAQTPSLTLPRDGTDAPADALRFYARELATGHAAYGGTPAFALRTIAHPDDIAAGTAALVDGTTGLFAGALPTTMPAEAATAVGPIELRLRVPWADRVERVPVFVEAAVLGSVRTVTAGETNARRPDWTFVVDGGPDDVVAAALVEVAGQPRRIAVIAETGRTLSRVGSIASPVVDDAHALTGFRQPGAARIVTLAASGWYAIDPTLLALVAIAPGPGTAADELVAMPSCAMPAVDQGILVRTGARWDGFTAPGPTPAGAGQAVGELAQHLRAFVAEHAGATLEDVLCVTIDQTPLVVAIMAVTDDTGYVGRFAVANVGAPMLLPFVGAVTVAVPGPGLIDIVGPIATDTGVRAVSYRVKQMDGVPALVPDEFVDYPLPSVPTKLIVARANADPFPDVLALVPYQGGITLSVTIGAARLGDELTALTRTGLSGQTPRFVRLPLLENDDLQMVIAGDSGLVAFDMLTPAHAVTP